VGVSGCCWVILVVLVVLEIEAKIKGRQSMTVLQQQSYKASNAYKLFSFFLFHGDSQNVTTHNI